jgi:hypothetical protein
MRVFCIILGTVIFVGLGLLLARFWGLSLQHKAFDHAFFRSPVTFVFNVQNFGQANDAFKASSTAALWLDVRVSRDHEFFVKSPKDLSAVLNPGIVGKGFLGTKPYFYDYVFLKSIMPDLKSLRDFLEQYPQQKFVLNILDNHESIHLHLAEALANYQPEQRILIQSETAGILEYLKKEKPFWLYGMSLAEVTRILSFDSIGLGPAIQLRGDVLVSPLIRFDREFVTLSLLAEMKRRKKRVLLGPLETDKQVQKAIEYYQKGLSDSFVISNISQWRLIDSQIGNALPQTAQF